MPDANPSMPQTRDVAGQQSRLPGILERSQTELLQEWYRELESSRLRRDDLMSESELREQCAEFLGLLRDAAREGGPDPLEGPAWGPVREMLGEVTRSRLYQGFSPSEIARFIFSLRGPLSKHLLDGLGPDAAFEEIGRASELLDQLGLYTTQVYQVARDQIIQRQREELSELATPVVKLWDNILALPLIGTLDSSRTQVVMETLLQRIVETGCEVAILDITGVPTVDSLVAQHLMRTVAAARLMGADCIICGIRPQIAQTIVHLGVGFRDVATRATLADAFSLALQQTGYAVVKR